MPSFFFLQQPHSVTSFFNGVMVLVLFLILVLSPTILLILLRLSQLSITSSFPMFYSWFLSASSLNMHGIYLRKRMFHLSMRGVRSPKVWENEMSYSSSIFIDGRLWLLCNNTLIFNFFIVKEKGWSYFSHHHVA